MENVLRLKEYRKLFNLSQRDVAEYLGMTQQGYNRWENGTASPGVKQILQLCEVFQCTPNDLFGIKGALEVTQAQMRGEIE